MENANHKCEERVQRLWSINNTVYLTEKHTSLNALMQGIVQINPITPSCLLPFLMNITYSISPCKSIIHNTYMLERFICVFEINPDPQVIDNLLKGLTLFTAKAA